MNKQPQGFIASNDFLARIAREAIAHEERVRAALEADARKGLCQWGTLAVGDRH